MSDSVGGLYLQAKLQTDQIEAQFRRLAASYEQQMTAAQRRVERGMASGPGGRLGRAAEAQIAGSRTVRREVEKNQEAVARATERSGQRQVREANRVANAQVAAARRSSSVTRALGSGSQELFVGLGAARSGNYFYGLAAGARYAKNLSAALRGVAPAAAVAGLGIGGITAAAVALLTVVTAVAVKLATFGVEHAANFEMLKIQLEGLLGSAKRSREEFTFLTELGKQSIVPTQALIAADRQLLAFGITADDTRRRLVRFFSDFGTATGAGEQQIYYLSLALSQVAAIGKANTIDMRQLANAGVNTMAIYKIIGSQIGMSARQVAAGVSEGLITSERLFAALDVYGARFTETAQKARNSTKGLWANIKDIVTTEMGKAFTEVNGMVSRFLRFVQQVVTYIDFQAIADSIEASIRNIGAAMGQVRPQVKDVADFFSVDLPNAIAYAGVAIARIVQGAQLAAQALLVLAQAVAAIVIGIVNRIVAATSLAVQVGDVMGAIPDDVSQQWRDSLDAMERHTFTGLKGIESDVQATVDQIEAIWNREITLDLRVAYTAPPGPFSQDGRSPANIDHYTPAYKPPKVPKPPTSPSGGGGGGQSAAMTAAQEWVRKYQELVDKATAARDTLAGIVRRPFGVDSDLQQSLTSGSTSSIIGTFDSIRDALTDLYAPLEDVALAGARNAARARAQHRRILAGMRVDFQALVDLAVENERIAKEAIPDLEEWFDAEQERIRQQLSDLDEWRNAREEQITTLYDGLLADANAALDAATRRYEEANDRLQELIQERDDFLSGVRDTLRGFVNDLSTVDEEIQKYTRLDPVGSFLIEATRQAGSFRQALDQRLAAVKAWTTNIRALLARGVDSTLVRDFVAQGMDSADVVAQLAGADAGTVAGVNATQAELSALIAGFNAEMSAQWFDAGVAQQEAIVAPLRSAFETARAEVARLEAEQRQALAVLKASYEERKALGEQQLEDLTANFEAQKTVLEGQMEANAAKAAEIAARVQGQFAALSTGAVAQGVATIQGLIDGLGDKEKEKQLVAAARRVARLVREEIAEVLAIRSPSRVGFYLGSMVPAGLAAGLDAGARDVAAAAARLGTVAIPSFTGGRVVSGARAGVDVDGVRPAEQVTNVFVEISDRVIGEIADVRIERAEYGMLDTLVAGRNI